MKTVLKKEVLGKELFRHPFGWCSSMDENADTLLICGSAVVDLNTSNVVSHVDPEDRLASAVATTSYNGDLYFLSEFDDSGDEEGSTSSVSAPAYWVCKWIPPADHIESMGSVEKLVRIDQDVTLVPPTTMVAQLAVAEKFVAVLWTTATGPSLAATRSNIVPAKTRGLPGHKEDHATEKKKKALRRTDVLHVVSLDGWTVSPVPPATRVLAQVTGGVAPNQPQAIRAKLVSKQQERSAGGGGRQRAGKLCYVCVALLGSTLALGMADGDIVFFSLTEQRVKTSESTEETVVVVPELNVQRRLCWHTSGGLRALSFGPGPEATVTTGLPALLYSAGDEGVLVAWQLSTGDHSYIPRLGNRGPIAALSLSPDCLHLAVASADGSVVLVDTTQNEAQLVWKGADITVRKLTCLSVPIAEHRTVEHVVACLCNEQVTLYSLPRPGNGAQEQFFLHETEISVARASYCCVGLARDSAGPVTFLYIATHTPSTLQVWRLVDGVAGTAKDPSARFSLYAIILQPHGSPFINSLAHHPSRPHVFSTARDGRWRCWQPTTDPETGLFSGKMGCQFAGVYRGKSCTSLTVSPCGSLLSILYGSEVTLWQPTGSGRLERVLYTPASLDDDDADQELQRSQFLAGSFDNNWDMGDSEPMLVACSRSRLFLWNLVSCSLVWQLDQRIRFLHVHPRRPSSFFVLPWDQADADQPLLTVYECGDGRSQPPQPVEQCVLPEPMFYLTVVPRKSLYSRDQCPLVGLPAEPRHRSLVRLHVSAADADQGAALSTPARPSSSSSSSSSSAARRRSTESRQQQPAVPPQTPEPIFASASVGGPLRSSKLKKRSLAVAADDDSVGAAAAAAATDVVVDQRLPSLLNRDVFGQQSSSPAKLARVAAVPAKPMVNPFADGPAPSAAPSTAAMFDSLINAKE